MIFVDVAIDFYYTDDASVDASCIYIYIYIQEKCLSENTLYQADISLENFQTKIYYSISETKLKTRFSNHKKSFNHEKHKNDTQLSNELWNIKASKEEPVLV